MTDEEAINLTKNTAGITAGAGMYQIFAVVAALAEARLIDPMKVAAWAEFFADNQGGTLAPEIKESVRDQVKTFAATLRTIASAPPIAGRA